MSVPRVVIAGLAGGVGKTTVSLGLVRAFTRQNLTVLPFKKGPDYTDTAWLALAANGKAGNLDPFFLDEQALRDHFLRRSQGADLAVIEGNRGFFDGRDVAGSASTAEVARSLDAPVVLVASIAKMTRTVAAVVAGCKNFPGGERIGGVILNHCAGERHAAITRRAVEELAGVPVFGVLPRLSPSPVCERRAGLVAACLHDAAEEALERMADVMCEHVDIGSVLDLARDVSSFSSGPVKRDAVSPKANVRIGVVRDDALWQYYDENLMALEEAGAELVFLSLLGGGPWPQLDGLYLGGGDLVPHAKTLAADTAKKNEIRALIESGLPVYAEHSGYFYLGERFCCDGVAHSMAGIFPVSAEVTEKPARLGYVQAVTDARTPFYPQGMALKGHEYHYADIRVDPKAVCAFRKQAGNTRIDEPDGLVYNAAFGTSMQVFAPAVPEWAESFVTAAAKWRK
ncbi:cobyrinate a,c-diamide synthase [Desulfovibrio sp. OttesenSCG-928-O18]|nr:cobyrinate a,c-diamide synthase [Desulfovibrio sp. OttesenSCG-928-O18]